MPTITDALKSICQSDPLSRSFCSINTTPATDLSIEVKGVGPINLPLRVNKIKSLISTAKPAKFGWQDQTLQDKNVRDAWEISKAKVKIDKRRWNATLSPILDKIKYELNLPDNSKLKAELHNLLIYEPGQFFNAHQDTEKLDGMIATLLIILPSAHSGGALIIDHQGEKKRFQSSRYSLEKLAFCAFYADCHHEVKPVKSGYRVVLSHNAPASGWLDGCEQPLGLPVVKVQTKIKTLQVRRSHSHRAVLDF